MSDLDAVWLLSTTARSRAIAACMEESGRARSVVSRLDGSRVLPFDEWFDARAVARAGVLPVAGASSPSLVGCPLPATFGGAS